MLHRSKEVVRLAYGTNWCAQAQRLGEVARALLCLPNILVLQFWSREMDCFTCFARTGDAKKGSSVKKEFVSQQLQQKTRTGLSHLEEK